MARHNRVGHWGEKLAVDHLTRSGYAIIETNWRTANFEIDIVAQHNNRLVFVEVKTRSNFNCDPLDAIDNRKINKMVMAAHNYILTHDSPLEAQFDIILISGTESNFTFEHIPDAFLPPLHRGY